MPKIPEVVLPPSYGGDKKPQELGSIIEVETHSGGHYKMVNLLGRRAGGTQENQIAFEYNWSIQPQISHGWVRIFGLDNPEISKNFVKGDWLKLTIYWSPYEKTIYRFVIDSVQPIEYRAHTWQANVTFSDGGDALGFFLSRHYARGTKAADAFQDLYEHYMRPHPINPPYDFHNATWNLLIPYIEEHFQVLDPTSPNQDEAFRKIYFMPKDPDIKYDRGITFFGPFWNAMKMLARDMKSQLFIYNRELYLIDPDKYAPGGGLLLNNATGLERFQRATSIQRSDTKVQYIEGTHDEAHYIIHALYDRHLGPGRQVTIDGLGFKGQLRIAYGTHHRYFDPDAMHAYPMRTEFVGELVK